MLDKVAADARRLSGASSRGWPWYVFEALLFDNGFQAVLFYRAASWFRHHGIPFLGPALSRVGLLVTGTEISAAAEIGPGLRISHGTGTVVGGHARIGSGAVLLHGVTIGSPSEGRVEEMPTVGDDVFVGAGAALIGDIEIGDRAVIGVNAVVTRDVPPDTTILAPEAVPAAAG